MKRLALMVLLFTSFMEAQTMVQNFQGGTGINTAHATGCPQITDGTWTIGSCGSGGGGTGNVNSGLLGTMVIYPVPGTNPTVGPSYPDATSGSGNFVDAVTKSGFFPHAESLTSSSNSGGANQDQAPFWFVFNSTKRNGAYNTGYVGTRTYININAGMESGLNGGQGGFNNVTGSDTLLQIHGNVQNGGTDSVTIYNYGANDTIRDVTAMHCAGVVRGDNEGCEHDRHITGFLNVYYGGSYTRTGTDALGNPIGSVTTTGGYDNRNSASDRILTDQSASWTSPGNVSSFTQWPTDHNYVQINGDGGSGLDAKFGASTITTLAGGADDLQYGVNNDQCTATGPAWPLDPYSGDQTGAGTKTAHKCIQVGSSAGFSVGQTILISGNTQFEYETVQSIPDGTHLVVTLIHPYDAISAGQQAWVSTGGCVGWGWSSPHDNLPPGYLNNIAGFQTSTQHIVYPCMASLPGNHLVVWSNVNVNTAELKTLAFKGTTASTPMTLTFSVTSSPGPISSLVYNSNNNYYSTAGAGTNSTGIAELPVPTVTFIGCSVAPTLKFDVVIGGSGEWVYVPSIVSGGTCTTGATASVQSVYPNPMVMYPTTRTRFITDPNVGCYGFSEKTNGCPANGYLVMDMTDQIRSSAAFNTGHTVEATINWNQYMVNQNRMYGSMTTGNSGRTGPTDIYEYGGMGHSGVSIIAHNNATPTSNYIGTRGSNWVPQPPSVGPCILPVDRNVTNCYDPQDNAYEAPAWHQYSGGYTDFLRITNPPTITNGKLNSQSEGTIIRIGCIKTVSGGFSNDYKCDAAYPNPVVDNFNIVRTDFAGGPHNFQWELNPTIGTQTFSAIVTSFKGFVTSDTGYRITGLPPASNYCMSADTNGNFVFTDPGSRPCIWYPSTAQGSTCSFSSGTVGTTCNTTVTMSPAQPDTNYVPSCMVWGYTGGPVTYTNVTPVSTTQFTMDFVALSTTSTSTGGFFRCTVTHL